MLRKEWSRAYKSCRAVTCRGNAASTAVPAQIVIQRCSHSNAVQLSSAGWCGSMAGSAAAFASS
eukprot:1148000-Pelagomonas_calceolata.AAC.3